MRDEVSDPAALELLRVQRNRLADRMRPPWSLARATGMRVRLRNLRYRASLAALVLLLQARLLGIRQELRDGGGAA